MGDAELQQARAALDTIARHLDRLTDAAVAAHDDLEASR
jgi:hypothetical protein